jgi:hypothetical protein
MSIRVVVPPDPIVAPEDISGVQSGDATVEDMIAAVTETIDGPDGWLGRCLGPQTLELRLEHWPCQAMKLPYPPLIEIESVSYFQDDGTEVPIDDGDWIQTGGGIWFPPSWSAPSLGCFPDPVKIVYQAGYDGEDPVSGGTGDVPAQAKQAIILSVQHMRSMSKDDLFLKVDEVDGIGRREFTVSDQAGKIIESACNRLLQGLKVYSI